MIRLASQTCQGRVWQSKRVQTMPKRRPRLAKPLPIGEILATRDLGPATTQLFALVQLRQAWPEIVGEELAARTEPKKIRGKTLIIAVENPAWSQQLSMMKLELLDALSERARKSFSDVRFVTESIGKKSRN